jgi:hypothetical protein
MEQKPVILLVNHREKNCGVNQYGQKVFLPLLSSTNFTIHYIDIDNLYEFTYWRDQLQPRVIIYNYYSGVTMPWLSHSLLDENRQCGIKQATLHHEGIPASGFDLTIDQDPTGSLHVENAIRIPRPIPEYIPHIIRAQNHVPVISSFGFGLGGKGFQRVVKTVVDQIPSAIIRLNIPFAKFGDEQGLGALSYFKECNNIIGDNPNYRLILTHELMPQDMLLDWLYESDINCFFYDDNYGRGISGTLDYCLAVRKPIAITQSWQFKHLWMQDSDVLIENHNLHEIMIAGIDHLEQFHIQWNTQTLLEAFENIFRSLLNANK